MIKKSFVPVLSFVAMSLSISGCQKTPEGRLADDLARSTSDKEIQRLNELRKSEEKALAELFPRSKKTNSSKSENQK